MTKQPQDELIARLPNGWKLIIRNGKVILAFTLDYED